MLANDKGFVYTVIQYNLTLRIFLVLLKSSVNFLLLTDGDAYNLQSGKSSNPEDKIY